MAGVSSQFVAQNYADASNETTWELMGCPELHVWTKTGEKGKEMPFADGGGVDNLAILPALRRGVKKLVICYAGSAKVEGDWSKGFYDVSGPFGAHGEEVLSVKAKVFNAHMQVFETEKFADF